MQKKLSLHSPQPTSALSHRKHARSDGSGFGESNEDEGEDSEPHAPAQKRQCLSTPVHQLASSLTKHHCIDERCLHLFIECFSLLMLNHLLLLLYVLCHLQSL